MRKMYIKPAARVVSDEDFYLCNASDLNETDKSKNIGEKSVTITFTNKDIGDANAKDNQTGWEDQYETFDW